MCENDNVLKIAIKNELFGEFDENGKNPAKEYFVNCLIKKIKSENINKKLIYETQKNGTIQLDYEKSEIINILLNKTDNKQTLIIYNDKEYNGFFKNYSNIVGSIYIPNDTPIRDILEVITSFKVKTVLIVDPILSLKANDIQYEMPDYNILSFTEQITTNIIDNMYKKCKTLEK